MVAAVVVAITASAAAHVAPSVDDNNRYLKITPFGDRVRLAYTVFFGEVPGAIARRDIDTNRDGQLSEAEGHAFGVAIASQVAAGLQVEVDGKVEVMPWASVDVGLGTPQVAAGSFSVDLIGYACLPTARGRHQLVVHDRYRIAHPGETEVKVEDAPGIAIDKAHVGPANDPSHDYRFAGPGGPLSDDGLELTFDAGPRSTVTPDAVCRAEPAGSHAWLMYAAIGAAVVVLGAVVVVLKRR
ncbi:MAG TPA: hypothetical protein VFQ65_15165 [Kofleriaceae bacterium]|nr:hypothetical protein [Kofleriaceae bacterium]